jgi:hypothetical protein
MSEVCPTRSPPQFAGCPRRCLTLVLPPDRTIKGNILRLDLSKVDNQQVPLVVCRHQSPRSSIFFLRSLLHRCTSSSVTTRLISSSFASFMHSGPRHFTRLMSPSLMYNLHPSSRQNRQNTCPQASSRHCAPFSESKHTEHVYEVCKNFEASEFAWCVTRRLASI